jgi:peptidoglycan hydrolase-like protein with peptidoglycan-binding domain
MRKINALALAIILGLGGVEALEASFGDALVGGVVGGVVGSVITNEVYRHGHRSRHTRHRRHRTRPVVQEKHTDEMKIQIALKNLGYYRGPIDGQVNSFTTRNAIRAFNQAYEIGDTSYMSPQERDALIYLGTLLQFDRNLAAQGSDRRTRTRRIQTALKVLGFYNGKLDGANGPMTRRAIAEYRRANGLPAGYNLDYETEYRLINTAKQSNDRYIQETLASLKRLGSAANRTPQPRNTMPAPRQPVILQPSSPQAPVQPTITQEAPAPVMQQPTAPAGAPMPVAPAPNAPVQGMQAAPQPVQPAQSPTPVQPAQPVTPTQPTQAQ